VRLADTSVLVAAFATWHPGHSVASVSLTVDVRIPEHVPATTGRVGIPVVGSPGQAAAC
jgi:hypothetical protein